LIKISYRFAVNLNYLGTNLSYNLLTHDKFKKLEKL